MRPRFDSQNRTRRAPTPSPGPLAQASVDTGVSKAGACDSGAETEQEGRAPPGGHLGQSPALCTDCSRLSTWGHHLELLGSILLATRPQPWPAPRKRLLPGGLRRQQVENSRLEPSLPPRSPRVRPRWGREAQASGIFQPSCSPGCVYLSWLPPPALFKADFLPSTSPAQASCTAHRAGAVSRGRSTQLRAAQRAAVG